ncbi:Dcp1p-Dcp2p decapping enzyme complex alpha subunit [Podila minutissima]|uniref:mRNA guanylyltransferase n=1 Tax=Podila minutissima TaxID=64525 RepID=A0A9P5VR48_9FUNG|nr:Dcp1p-Dcp2p decapping enzyme complex alpha subunit [Podila minutissima]
MSYFVSEKSDGVRVLLYCVVGEDGKQNVYLVDRKNKFSHVQELVFPAPGNQGLLHETVVDGELVTDTEPDGQQLVRYLAFDLLATNGQSIIDKPLGSRLARLQSEFITPYRQMLQNPNVKLAPQPFRVSLKQMELSYGIDKMFFEVIPHLRHGNDGLIFTSAVAPYIPSTNSKMLKWKPPSENTIDFRLTLESTSNHKPLFVLHEWLGGQNYSRFGQLTVPDDLWQQWQSTSTELQNRVVEVNYSPSDNTWRFFRFRDDKEHGNHSSVVQKVVHSIQDGVEREEVEFKNGQDNELYKSNKEIKLSIQKRISMPALNKPITTITAQDLHATSEFVFEAKKEYIIDQQTSIPCRVRAS